MVAPTNFTWEAFEYDLINGMMGCLLTYIHTYIHAYIHTCADLCDGVHCKLNAMCSMKDGKCHCNVGFAFSSGDCVHDTFCRATTCEVWYGMVWYPKRPCNTIQRRMVWYAASDDANVTSSTSFAMENAFSVC